MTTLAASFDTIRPSPIVRRAVRDGLALAGLTFAAFLFLVVAPKAGTFGFDAYAYWSVNMTDPYTVPAGTFGAFTYTPIIARLFSIFSLLAWPTFLWMWTAIMVATVIWLGWRSALLVLAFPPVALELYHGNIELLMAAAIALGFRYPVAWSFVLLTKVTPGVGLVWFAARREWRHLAIALGFTGALVAASLVLEPQLWVDWVNESILKTAGGAPLGQFSIAVPLVVRLPLAAVLVWWGGRTGRPWTVAVAATLALPILWPSGLALLAALWPITQRRPQLDPRGSEPLKSAPTA